MGLVGQKKKRKRVNTIMKFQTGSRERLKNYGDRGFEGGDDENSTNGNRIVAVHRTFLKKVSVYEKKTTFFL